MNNLLENNLCTWLLVNSFLILNALLDVIVIFQVYINIIYNLCFARYEYEYANNYEYKYELTKTKKVKKILLVMERENI